jgi:drug/metabolite transporter (DMT)-like permease
MFNTVVWGATFVVVKGALEDVSPLLFLALRFTLAAAVLALVFRRVWKGDLRPLLRPGIVCGVLLFAGYALQTMGLRLTSAPKSAFITGLSVPLVPLFAALVYQVKPRAAELLGVSLAVAGMALMTLEGASLSMGWGDLLTVGCAIAFAGHIVALGHYTAEVGFEVLTPVQVGVAALLALAVFQWAETPRLVLSPAVWSAILITGLLATALAYGIQSWAQQYTTSTRTALIFTLEPLFAWATSWVLTGETLSPRGVSGALLILGGVLVVEVKPVHLKRHPSQ